MIGLISDTHGLLRPEAVAALQGASQIIHAGDAGAPEVLDALRAIAPVSVVRGNVDRGDWAQALPATLIVEADGVLLYCLHDLGDLDLDLVRREARRGERLLQLTAQEFALLEYLCRNAGRVVTRTLILDHVWRMRIDPATNVVDVHIYRLRSKVDVEGMLPLIHTIRGIGYVLKPV